MRNKGITKLFTALVILAMCFATNQNANAQGVDGSSSMVFSPYTMYGLGDLIPLGTASSMAMGGVGLGFRSPYEINYKNPAALSALMQRTALFSFGARGTNNYLKTPSAKTAYNSFDISDVGFAVPLYRGIGLSFALNPVSAIGYRNTVIDETQDVVANIGRAVYNYTGSGGVSQVGMGLGVMVVRGFSLGANVHYYFGNLNRNFSAHISPMLGQETSFRDVISTSNIHVSHLLYSFGAQYSVRVGRNNALTLGLTYQPAAQMNPRMTELQTVSKGIFIDTLYHNSSIYPIKVPAKMAAGLTYVDDRLTIGFDWTQQDWENAFDVDLAHKITLRKQVDYGFGMSFCPDRANINSAMLRWTYKVGAHYSESYLNRDNTSLSDIGFTLGVDVPLRKNAVSKLSVGLDFGRRGIYRDGQVLDNYFKIYAGITLFGGDGDLWFFKRKFD